MGLLTDPLDEVGKNAKKVTDEALEKQKEEVKEMKEENKKKEEE